jgi:hypothetical protein
MNIEQVEKNLTELVKNFQKDEFIFDLLLAYGTPKATITLLKKGRHNLSKQDGRIILKSKLFFQDINNIDLHQTIDSLQKDVSTKRHNPRFIIVTDYQTLLAVDTKTNEHLDIPIKDIIKYYDFFLPWAGIEKHKHTIENPADRKAAEKMAKLYDEILVENSIGDDEKKIHGLNVFLARLLFCFFAEDTNIFEDKLFTSSIASHTQGDGSDFNSYLDILFDVLNSADRSKYPQYLQKFPYVNGGLFEKKHWVPIFTARSRKIVIECGELNWSQINPDIFGSMMQAVVHDRSSLGMHYTSVPNILKVIEPLFLNELNEEFDKCNGNKKKLQKLLQRISNIKFFDPACGSGNFLIIAYKEIRRFEMKVLKELNSVAYFPSRLKNFYGIEIDDFAHEITKLSLYLAEHQMNVEFLREFGRINPTLPLKSGGNIVCANALRIDWDKVCLKNEGDEIYILGNPPYLGQRNQKKHHQEDLDYVFKGYSNYKNLDYVSAWFIKACKYIKNENKFAFVSTNSIYQGTQVEMLWDKLLKKNIEIFFAYPKVRWDNNAKNKASVICSIVGIRKKEKSKVKKYIFTNTKKLVYNINPYLIEGADIIIKARRGGTLSNLPVMEGGNQPREGGYLILSEKEKDNFINNNPDASKFLRKLVGSREFLNGIKRYCIWIDKNQVEEALRYPDIKKRINQVKQKRLNGNTLEKNFANYSFRFVQNKEAKKSQFIIPVLNSDKCNWLSVGSMSSEFITTNRLNVIFDPPPYIFSILSSRMHLIWVLCSSGKFGSQINYTSTICYNSFPFPTISEKQINTLGWHASNIIEEREKYSEKTIAQLYNLNKMPIGLKEAHQNLDLAVERCYRSKPFASDEERLEYLFKLYEQMIEEEKIKNSKNLFSI